MRCPEIVGLAALAHPGGRRNTPLGVEKAVTPSQILIIKDLTRNKTRHTVTKAVTAKLGENSDAAPKTPNERLVGDKINRTQVGALPWTPAKAA